MYSRFPSVVLFALFLALPCLASEPLTLCADPDNLPYSNQSHQGYENRIAKMLAVGLQRKLIYRWARMDRGFVREFLNRGECDVLIEVPSGFAPVLTTRPFYQSTYVFVSRRSDKLRIQSFDDPRLRRFRIGVQMVGDDYASPGIALTRRALVKNIVGFKSVGPEAKKIILAVSSGQIDIAIVWGPLAGYYARSMGRRLELTPVPPFDPPGIPFRYELSMAVRKGNAQLLEQLNSFLSAHQAAINNVLRDYGVPLVGNDENAIAGGGS